MVGRFILLLLLIASSFADNSLRVAVTSSFRPVLEALAADFERQTAISLRLSSAATGLLAQQILAGAPFDLFLAADQERPQLLITTLGLPAYQHGTYARGSLLLVSANEEISDLSNLAAYRGRVVIANPTHAPYGAAAAHVLDRFGFNGERVLANNVAQARQYLALRLVDVGVLAAALATDLDNGRPIALHHHAPILHDYVILGRTAQAQQLLDYLATEPGRALLNQFGYLPPLPS